MEHLSQIIEELNKRFGLNLNDADKVLFDQLEETWATDETVAAQARANTYENFRLAFDPKFMDTILRRMSDNEAIVMKILDTPELEAMLKDWYAQRVYDRVRRGSGESHEGR